ncbi:fasciclin domain-containing protein [Candidatus Saccharibacteria bacterium]|nr:fasciclin domain-containing protein [Candidatus Saccharibacteria bacterium]
MKKDSTSNSNSSSMSTDKDGGDGVTVGGAKMVKDKDIVDNAVNADNVTTLVSLVKLADLVDTLKGEGPFTVFGPNNGAFAKLDAATVESLQKPENKAALANILTYHVVPGTYTSAALKVMATKGETLKSVQGEVLTPVMDGGMLKIQDAKCKTVAIETSDVLSSNGVTHVIDSVLMP